ncbi:MAG: hypothetical protein AAGA31_13195 [Bacteroidota bacterium]
MARSKSMNLTIEDAGYVVGGALAGMALNLVANKALASQSENIRQMAGRGIPAAKVIGGGYLATKKKMDRRLRMAGLGLAATGGIELGRSLAPQYFGIGSADDVFSMIGSPDDVLSLPVVPSAPLEQPLFQEEAVMGTYQDGAVL